MLPLDDPAVVELGDGRDDLVGHAVLLHPHGELVSDREVVRSLDVHVADRARAVELGMAVRIADDGEDLGRRGLDEDAARYPSCTGVD
jgi:hypothetical protein